MLASSQRTLRRRATALSATSMSLTNTYMITSVAAMFATLVAAPLFVQIGRSGQLRAPVRTPAGPTGKTASALGGAMVLLASAAGAISYRSTSLHTLVIAAVAIALIGVLHDARGLPARWLFAVELAATGAAVASGLRTRLTGSTVFDVAAAVALLLVGAHAISGLEQSDSLTALVLAPSAAVLAFVSLDSGDRAGLIAAATLCGAL